MAFQEMDGMAVSSLRLSSINLNNFLKKIKKKKGTYTVLVKGKRILGPTTTDNDVFAKEQFATCNFDCLSLTQSDTNKIGSLKSSVARKLTNLGKCI